MKRQEQRKEDTWCLEDLYENEVLFSQDAEKLDAEYKNGILYITLPKQQPETPTSKRLEIK